MLAERQEPRSSFGGAYDSFTIGEQADIDTCLLKFARTGVAERRPRNATGEVFVWREGNVTCCHESDALDVVQNQLSRENILSMPVLDEYNKYIGVISVGDIGMYLIRELLPGDVSEQSTDFNAKRNQFRSRTVFDVMRATASKWSLRSHQHFSQMNTLLEGYSLLHAFEILARTGCHRIPVVNEYSRITGFYNESMALSDLRQNLYLLGPITELKIFNVKQSPGIVSVKEDTRAIDAFRLMADKNIGGLPIVDSNGILSSVLSIRDLRAIGATGENLSRLLLGCREFREHSRMAHPLLASSSHWSTRAVPRGALYLTPNHTLRDTIDKMQDGNLHRVVVCSQASHDRGEPQPISVITQRDVIQQVLISMGTMRLQHLEIGQALNVSSAAAIAYPSSTASTAGGDQSGSSSSGGGEKGSTGGGAGAGAAGQTGQQENTEKRAENF